MEGTIYLDGIKLNIIDTAGIRETDDIVESIGVEKSLEALENANLVLLLLNNNEELTEEDQNLISKTCNKTTIFVINKNDLETKLDINSLKLENVISINTIDYQGIDTLKNKIKELFKIDMINNSDFTYITNLRQITKVKLALNTLKELEMGLSNEKDLDILEIDLKDIWNTLGLITGESYDEELLDDLFKNFCVGK